MSQQDGNECHDSQRTDESNAEWNSHQLQSIYENGVPKRHFTISGIFSKIAQVWAFVFERLGIYCKSTSPNSCMLPALTWCNAAPCTGTEFKSSLNSRKTIAGMSQNNCVNTVQSGPERIAIPLVKITIAVKFLPNFSRRRVLDGDPGKVAIIIGVLFLLLVGLVFIFLFGKYFNLWLRGLATRANISPLTLVGMSLQKINPALIVEAKITAVQAGITDIPTNSLSSHHLAGGNVTRVVRALIAAHRASIALDWDTAAAIDLAGRDVLEAVRTSVDPKVIDCPDTRNGRTTLDGVAKDGIQLKARARVTVRTNLSQLIGGATEDTVIARVGEGIVSAIGSSDTHKVVLANPALIAQAVLRKSLDSQTAYEIVSIDIADIDVGDNVGARLQADQAEADMRVARAEAEQRRAEAVATEQEMQALTQENRAKVVLAEAEIPKAMAGAYLSGTLRAANNSHASPVMPNGEA